MLSPLLYLALDDTNRFGRMVARIGRPYLELERVRLSAHDWRYVSTDRICDSLVGRVMDNDVECSEEREMMLRTTLRELVANGQRALTQTRQGIEHYSRRECITAQVVYGPKGVVLRVRDAGAGFNARCELAKRRALLGLLARHGAMLSHGACAEGLRGGGTGLYTLALGLESFGYEVVHNPAGNDIAVRVPFDNAE